MQRINIIRWDNRSGLSRTAKIIYRVLKEAGFSLTITSLQDDCTHQSLFRRQASYLATKFSNIKSKADRVLNHNILHRYTYDINLFLQHIRPEWFPYAPINYLIPNQEWFYEEWHPYIGQFDGILCKTKFAQEVFDKLGGKTQFISFTSDDRFNEKQNKDYNAFFHLAGRSLQKGTNTLIDVWLKHPEWPHLKIIQNPRNAKPITAPNIEYVSDYIDETLLRKNQNFYGVHLCPSEAEGFGHYIVEAMSCKALTIATNAPPMNELVTPDRGVLANYRDTKLQGLGINYYVDPNDLEQKIDKVLGMDNALKKQLGENARDWYQQNDKFFKNRLVEIIKGS